MFLDISYTFLILFIASSILAAKHVVYLHNKSEREIEKELKAVKNEGKKKDLKIIELDRKINELKENKAQKNLTNFS